jgi:hypothetical protein
VSELNARDKQEMAWRTDLVLAIEKLRHVLGAEMAVEEFERAIVALDSNTAITPATFNSVFHAHRVVLGGS